MITGQSFFCNISFQREICPYLALSLSLFPCFCSASAVPSAKSMYSKYLSCVPRLYMYVLTYLCWYLFKMGMLNGMEIACVTRIYLEGREGAQRFSPLNLIFPSLEFFNNTPPLLKNQQLVFQLYLHIYLDHSSTHVPTTCISLIKLTCIILHTCLVTTV